MVYITDIYHLGILIMSPVGTAKLFKHGRSQAVRLPKEFRMPGKEVLVRRQGNQLVLEPLDANGLPIGFWNDIDRLMDGLDFPDPEPIGAELLDLRGDD